MLPKDICDLLEESLNEKIENFEIEEHEGNQRGQGHLGEMVFLSLKNKITGEDHHLVVKQCLEGAEETSKFMSMCFNNEVHFYKNVIPAVEALQKSYPKVELFNNIPKCFATSSKKREEKLVMENLNLQGYKGHPKKIPLNSKMFEIIFKTYGKFHGISYAFKHYHPEQFTELGARYQKNLKMFFEQGMMKQRLISICTTTKEFLEEEDEIKIIDSFKKFSDNAPQMFFDALEYKSPYSVFLHGDCWSNNMMFKHNKSGDIEDIKLFDFQMAGVGSPVLDLTYSFYSGADEESLSKLDHFLEIYYKSLSETLKEYGCSAEKIVPFAELKKEWKEQNAFGVLLGLLIWNNKNLEPSETPDVAKLLDGDSETDNFSQIVPNKDSTGFKKASLSVMRHLYKNKFL
ncbi:uncharacterized protein LOC114331581 [Diabrotica virgifera virgifera]|uniref:CHK kinase-like domain-containing protein n=1 Tax=Diabrotica virgifera virgifera TaxID=50390 RepID=A0ABM5IN58_DIAVI|nr:uncharacterized protein LOC114331581 [Diabrotica virgifera virgifera]